MSEPSHMLVVSRVLTCCLTLIRSLLHSFNKLWGHELLDAEMQCWTVGVTSNAQNYVRLCLRENQQMSHAQMTSDRSIILHTVISIRERWVRKVKIGFISRNIKLPLFFQVHCGVRAHHSTNVLNQITDHGTNLANSGNDTPGDILGLRVG